MLRFWALEAFGSGAVYSPNQKAVTSWVKKFQPNKQLGRWHYGIMLDSIQLISIVTTCYRSRSVFCFPTKSVSVDLWTIVIINYPYLGRAMVCLYTPPLLKKELKPQLKQLWNTFYQSNLGMGCFRFCKRNIIHHKWEIFRC